MNRRLLISNASVAILGVVGLAYIAIGVVGVNPLQDKTTIVVELPETGGLFDKSEVTYRGTIVGTIESIQPRPGGIEVAVALDEGIEIPRDTRVVVSGLSPVGEQTLDFRPRADAGPFLEDGDVVPESATVTPVEFHRLITSVDALVRQVDVKDLKTVINEAYIGTRGAGPDMRRLLSDSQAVIAMLQGTLPETRSLLANGGHLLETADALTTDLAAFSRDARRLTGALRSGEPIFRRLLAKGPPALETTAAGLAYLTPAAIALLQDGSDAMAILAMRLPALNEVLVTIPLGATALSNALHDGAIHAIGDIWPSQLCRYGTPMREPWYPSDETPDLNKYCTERAPDLQQRGAYNAPQ